MDRILSESDADLVQGLAREAVLSAQAIQSEPPSPLATTADVNMAIHRRLAATLRDLSEDLRLLPDRLNHLAHSNHSFARNTPPSWLGPTLRLARQAGFDATSLGLLETCVDG